MQETIAKLVPHDKALHIIAGSLIAAVFLFFDPVLAICMVALAGIAKEGWDLADGKQFSWPDLLFTIAGGFIPIIGAWISH